ncbi:hypothetical protein GQ53DRAFT_791557 [Thozetella sp. PMI_491]|nr:hypothetical protein GQ53DRAFT_791557 [Thozetella sp. PMI_491]
MFEERPGRLVYHYDGEVLWVEPWGPNAFRIRASKHPSMPSEDWALDEPAEAVNPSITLPADADATGNGIITNGLIQATVSPGGKLIVYDTSKSPPTPVLEEYARTRRGAGLLQDPKCSALEIEAREFKPLVGGDYALTWRLESLSRNERLYGMGQYQQEGLNLKGSDLELAQRNSQASVPFLLSSLGYGLLWNNPAVGRAVLGTNTMSFEARSTQKLDVWIVVGKTPKEIVQTYTRTTGLPPPMPEYGLGFWQSKLRYQTQEELLTVAREYARRKLRLDVLVIDFFHWPAQGEWCFDPVYWPDPAAMVKELRSLGIEPMVSIWPTVQHDSTHFEEMKAKGLLIRSERGFRVVMDFQGNTVHFDATNPAAREYVWEKARENYGKYGIRLFWLDEAEPEYAVYDYDNWRYHLGSCLSVGNIYPREYARAFFEGAKTSPTAIQPGNLVNLIRCAWAGSQKFGALVWSGDVASSWPSLRQQLTAGLNMGVAGIAYWTTDIGGFHGGDPTSPAFRELLVRWFQWGAFLPVFRLHGDRWPEKAPLGDRGGGKCPSGADNEVWSYGEEVGKILEKYMKLRESLRDYVRETLREASEKGTPVIRPMFLEFPDDEGAQDLEDQYMFGSKYLVAPILYPGAKGRKVYFPPGGGEEWISAELDFMPVFTPKVESKGSRKPLLPSRR